jgi:hypothetical protein
MTPYSGENNISYKNKSSLRCFDVKYCTIVLRIFTKKFIILTLPYNFGDEACGQTDKQNLDLSNMQSYYFIKYCCSDHSGCVLRHKIFSPPRTLESWVRIPLKARMSICSDLASSWSPVQGVLPAVYKIHNCRQIRQGRRRTVVFYVYLSVA